MSNDSLPPFHLPSEKGVRDRDLYALAFVRGDYVCPSDAPPMECFYVIYLREPGARQRFCLMTINEAGRIFSRANPLISNVDQVFLWAWDSDEVHPSQWTLYCEDIEADVEQIADPAVRRAYLEVVREATETVSLFYMRRVSKEVIRARAEERNRPAFEMLPLFRFKSGRQQKSIQPLVERLRSRQMSSGADLPAV